MRVVNQIIKRAVMPLKNMFLATGIGFLVGAVIISICGKNPLEAYAIMFKGAFGTPYYFTTTLMIATPIIICALGVAFSWRCGYSNLGLAGQMIWGGLVASQLALYVPGNGAVKIVAAIIGAMAVGGLYAFIPAFLNYKFNVSLIIATLMMNYIATNISFYFVQYHLLDPEAKDTAAVQTAQISAQAQLPKLLEGYSLHAGFIIAILCSAAFYWIFKYTKFGYHSRMCGLNANFSVYGGENHGRMIYATMVMSGAMAGLAGAVEVLGTRYRFINGAFDSSGFAWTGITASLMMNHNPIGILISSIFLAGISAGSAAVQRSIAVPLEVANMIQGTITLFITAKFVMNRRHVMKKDKAEKEVTAA